MVVFDTGAYGSVMASNYNRRPMPAEILVQDGKPRVIRRRQTIDDLVALES
jgi:diaminopimelate decarboxylase